MEPEGEWCKRAGKFKHSTRSAAQNNITNLKQRKKARSQVNAYQCEFCNHWHLTSHPSVPRSKRVPGANKMHL